MRSPNNPGRFLRHLFLFVMAGALAVSFSQTITLSGKNGPPTSRLAVSGTGFPVNSAIDIYFDTTDLALTVTDGTGAFTKVVVQVPSSALPGSHYITAVARANSSAVQIGFLVSTSWPQLGFAPTNQRFNPYENVLAPSNVNQLDVAWTFPNGSIFGSPAEAVGTVFIGSFDSNLYAINATTGKTRWSFPTGSNIFATPAVAQGKVYFGSYDGNFYAVNAGTGALVWSYPTGFPLQDSATVVNGVVFIGAGGTLLALNAQNGTLLWSATVSGTISNQAAVADGMVFVDGSNLQVFNASNGSPVWNTAENSTFGVPLITHGQVYVNSSSDESFEGFNVFNGVNQSATVSPVNTYTAAASVLYTGSTAGFISATNSAGTGLWSYATGGAVNSTPAVAGGVVYAGSDDGNIYALDASSGSYLWSFDFFSAVASPPIVANGMLFLTGPDGNLYAFGLPSPPKQAQAPQISSLHPDLSLKLGQSR